MFLRMLVPLDGSRLAESVLGAVEGLGRLTGCSVKLLHVIEKSPPSSIHGDVHLKAREEAEAYLATVADRLKVLGLKVDTHVHDVPLGDVPRSIAEHADELDQDLIVLCSHGKGGLKRFVFGSNAEQVITHGRTPVMLIRATEDDIPRPFALERILIPVNFTVEEKQAVRMASELAGLAKADLHLVAIIPTLESTSAEEAVIGRFIPGTTKQFLQLAAEEAGTALEGEIKRLRDEGTRAEGSVRRGDMAVELLRAARRVHADLIVVATRGLAGLGAFWADVLARKIAGLYEGPILLIPHGDKSPKDIG